MTPAKLRAWITRSGLNTYTAPAVLGVSRRTLMRYLSGEIETPKPVAKLIELQQEQRNGKARL
jgi:hypothetical protein